jgi:hypothetical protein
MWLIDDENIGTDDLLKLRLRLLTVLHRLPIQNRNQLNESKLLDIVSRFTHMVCDILFNLYLSNF